MSKTQCSCHEKKDNRNMPEPKVDVEMLYQLTKQTLADKHHEQHITALFHAIQAKKENNAWHLSLDCLSKDYFIALFGGAYTEMFIKSQKKGECYV